MKTKTVKVALDSFGSFLGRKKGCLVVRDGGEVSNLNEHLSPSGSATLWVQFLKEFALRTKQVLWRIIRT